MAKGLRVAPRSLSFLVASVCACLLGVSVAHAFPGRASASGEVMHVTDEVEGDVVSILSDLVVESDAVVHGHAVAILGQVEVEPGARIDGRVISIRSLAGLVIEPESDDGLPLLPVAMRLLTTGGWLLATTLLTFMFPVRIRNTVGFLRELGMRVVVLGAVAFVTFFAALAAVLGLGPTFGVPLAATLFVVFIVAKAVGLAVVGGGLGSLLVQRFVRRPLPLTFDVFVGVGLLALARFVPVVGGGLWTLLSVAALGAAVSAAVAGIDDGASEMSVFT